MSARTMAAAAAVLVAALPVVTGGAGADDDGAGFGPLDIAFDCNELVPESFSPTAGLIEPSEPITVSVHVLRDGGVTDAQAHDLVAAAGQAYAPLNITLVLAGVDTVVLDSDGASAGRTLTDAAKAIAKAKEELGSRPPGDAHLVHVLTDKDLFLDFGPGVGRQPVVAGMADCIGGIRWPDHSFAVSEVHASIDDEIEAEMVAHEIGHLFGAQHHYANCLEAVCTLMFNDVAVTSLRFSSLSSAVVRGHACFEVHPTDCE